MSRAEQDRAEQDQAEQDRAEQEGKPNAADPRPGGTEGKSKPHQPTEVSQKMGFFDRFAQRAADIASRAPFFAFCVLLLLLWGPSYFVLKKIDTWQLIINTATTIITFLMVALLQNTQTRNDQATQHKLNAIADGLADLMTHVGRDDPEIVQDIKELAAAVGLEDRETTG
jgi:low affinity iron permease